jgi:hypothetical protein
MKRLIQLSLLLLISSATAQESQPKETSPQQPTKTLRIYDWNDLARQQTLPGEVISMDGMSVLKIENTNDAPLVVSFFKITNSAIIEKAFVVSFEMKYENVQVQSGSGANGFEDSPLNRLIKQREAEGITNVVIGGRRANPEERWVNPGRLSFLQKFPPDFSGQDERTNKSEFYFSGTSIWKAHDLKVDRTENVGFPMDLELKLSLPRSGTIYLRPVKILGVVGSWWTPQQISLIGGIGGSVIGCFGALLGLLASRGKARTFVLTTMKIFIALGILLTIAGFAAVVSGQPYAVWYALLLPGVILTLVFSLTLPSIQRRYDELEIRRMTSVDAM